MYKKVITAEIISGVSPFAPYLPPSNMWEILLECGHVVYRGVKYKPTDYPRKGWHIRRDSEEALPAPKRCKCETCLNKDKKTKINNNLE